MLVCVCVCVCLCVFVCVCVCVCVRVRGWHVSNCTVLALQVQVVIAASSLQDRKKNESGNPATMSPVQGAVKINLNPSTGDSKGRGGRGAGGEREPEEGIEICVSLNKKLWLHRQPRRRTGRRVATFDSAFASEAAGGHEHAR